MSWGCTNNNVNNFHDAVNHFQQKIGLRMSMGTRLPIEVVGYWRMYVNANRRIPASLRCARNDRVLHQVVLLDLVNTRAKRPTASYIFSKLL